MTVSLVIHIKPFELPDGAPYEPVSFRWLPFRCLICWSCTHYCSKGMFHLFWWASQTFSHMNVNCLWCVHAEGLWYDLCKKNVDFASLIRSRLQIYIANFDTWLGLFLPSKNPKYHEKPFGSSSGVAKHTYAIAFSLFCKSANTESLKKISARVDVKTL